jgi:DNA-binding transcriptional LysR family regulator
MASGWRYERRGVWPQRTIELGSYHAMLGCVIAGMGAALLPKSVLDAFPESGRLSVHALPPGERRMATLLIWRRGAGSPKVDAPREILLSQGSRVRKTPAQAGPGRDHFGAMTLLTCSTES